MSSKNKRKMQTLGYPNTLGELQKHKRALEIHEINLIEKSLSSNNPNDIIEAQNHLRQGSKTKQQVDMKSFMFAPEHEFYSGMGYKNKLTSISYLLLRQMARTPQINAIIQTRVDQSMNFSSFVTDEQKPGWTIRKRLGHFADEKERELSDLDKREIDAIVSWMEQGGRDVDEWEREDMSSFFKKLYRDSWEIDQAAFEVSWLRKGIPYQYQSVDGGTIRLAETFDDREYQEQKASGKYMPKYVQVWKNLVHNEYYPMELCLGMRNTASDVMLNGYGVSELEILIQIVTWMLYGMQYNGNFFQQGSNPKGILNFKQNIDPIKLEEFKQGWRNTLTGIGNCLSENTHLFTDKGEFYISELFEDNDEDKNIKVWTGQSFQEARVFKTGIKSLTRMFINNGTHIECSPEHRFMVIGGDGLPVWKERKDITVGDFVLTNKNSISNTNPIYYKGKLIEDDLFEVLGWMIGDGYIGRDIPKKRRCELYYHHEKEIWISERHQFTLEKYGINSYISKDYLKDPEKTRIRYGFKTINEYHLKIYVIDSEFHNFIMGLGFTSSFDGKEIPKFIFTESSKNKCSFLKGFFSADGNNSTGRAIQMTIVDNNLREQTKMLLLSEGINCGNHEGKEKSHSFGRTEAGYLLLIKDVDTYFSKVGFLQPHKQMKDTAYKTSYLKESISLRTAKVIAKLIIDKDDFIKKKNGKRILSTVSRDNLISLLKGKKGITRQAIEKHAKTVELDLPDYFINYNFEKVIKVEDVGIEVSMYDVEVFDDQHQFIANGMVTHNSHKMAVTAGADLEWIAMQQTNKDMEFHQWNDFMTILSCTVFRIDPDEVGFHLQGSKGIFGQDGQKQRLDHSKQKGLEPFLRYWQSQFDQYLVKPLSKGKYEFIFTGLTPVDEDKALEKDIKLAAAGGISLQDFFLKYSGRKLNEKKDIILNQVFLSYKQMQQMGGEQSNQAVDNMTGEEQNPYSQFEEDNVRKGEDPFAKAFVDYMNNTLKKSA